MTLFSTVHGDWYEDQRSGNIDNYEEFRVGYNPNTGKFTKTYVTLRFECFDPGYTAQEIIDWIKSYVAKRGLDLTDYVTKEWYGLKEYPELRKVFAEIIMFSN